MDCLPQGVPLLSSNGELFVRSVLCVQSDDHPCVWVMHLGRSTDYSTKNRITFGHLTGFTGRVEKDENSLDALARYAEECGGVMLVEPKLVAVVDIAIETPKREIRTEVYRSTAYMGKLTDGSLMYEHQLARTNELPFDQMLPNENPARSGWLLPALKGERLYQKYLVRDISLANPCAVIRRNLFPNPATVAT